MYKGNRNGPGLQCWDYSVVFWPRAAVLFFGPGLQCCFLAQDCSVFRKNNKTTPVKSDQAQHIRVLGSISDQAPEKLDHGGYQGSEFHI